MRTSSKRITIIHITKPSVRSLNNELQWFGAALGLFNLRDKDKSCFRIFIELLKSTKKGLPVTSEQISERLHLSRGTVVHHLNKLIETGIVIPDRNKYILRVDNLEMLIDEIQRDTRRAFEDLKQVASEIDRWMEL